MRRNLLSRLGFVSAIALSGCSYTSPAKQDYNLSRIYTPKTNEKELVVPRGTLIHDKLRLILKPKYSDRT